jgi:hypothetical protein
MVFPPEGASDRSAVAIAVNGDELFVAEEGGGVRAFRYTEGQSLIDLWQASLGFPVDQLLTAGTEHVVCISQAGKIAVLSALDGASKSFLDLRESLTGRSSVAGVTLLVSKAAGVTAFNIPNLQFLWTNDSPPSPGKSICTCNGILVFEDDKGLFHILDAATGKERYSLSAMGGQAASDGERLYLSGRDGNLGAYNLMDGVPIWTTGASSPASSTIPGESIEAPRLAITKGRVYLAGPSALEIWNSVSGELIDRVPLSSRTDGIAVLSGVLCILARGSGPYCFGPCPDAADPLSIEAFTRPDAEVIQRITTALEKYSDPNGSVPKLAWRAYVQEAVLVEGADFTIFRYDVKEAGSHSFRALSTEGEGALIALFDSNGEERHVNVGELGVDKTFKQWQEAGGWYVALGHLRGSQGTLPAFLEIQ